MKCPICEVEMRISQREGIEIDYCPQCRGVWLDRGELEKLIARVESSQLSASGEDDDDDDGEHDEYRHSGYSDRESSYRRRNKATRDEQDRSYRGDDYPRHRKHKREGFLSNLFEMFGGD